MVLNTGFIGADLRSSFHTFSEIFVFPTGFLFFQFVFPSTKRLILFHAADCRSIKSAHFLFTRTFFLQRTTLHHMLRAASFNDTGGLCLFINWGCKVSISHINQLDVCYRIYQWQMLCQCIGLSLIYLMYILQMKKKNAFSFHSTWSNL